MNLCDLMYPCHRESCPDAPLIVYVLFNGEKLIGFTLLHGQELIKQLHFSTYRSKCSFQSHDSATLLCSNLIRLKFIQS